MVKKRVKKKTQSRVSSKKNKRSKVSPRSVKKKKKVSKKVSKKSPKKKTQSKKSKSQLKKKKKATQKVKKEQAPKKKKAVLSRSSSKNQRLAPKNPTTHSTKKESTSKQKNLFELEQELATVLDQLESVSLKDSEGLVYCLQENCDFEATTSGYCRYHYMISWDKIKDKDKIIKDKMLQTSLESLLKKYSPRILTYMIKDLSNEKDFQTALSEMKIIKN